MLDGLGVILTAQAIVRTLADGSEYPAGCVFEVSEGSGCALLYLPDGKACSSNGCAANSG